MKPEKERKTIAVIFGGCSSEHNVSLQSAYGIISHISHQRYEPVIIGITKEGRWYLYEGDIRRIQDGSWYMDEKCIPAVISPDKKDGGLIFTEEGKQRLIRLDAALPVLHGRFGEDGTIQGLLELAGIPVIGCGTMSSAICMDKDMSHRLVESAGIRVPKSLVLDGPDKAGKAADWAKEQGYPIYVKPAAEGSSIGISKVYDESQLDAAVKNAFEYDTKVLLEENIEGFEVGCAVLGKEELLLGTVDEIETPDGFFDFVEKYTQEKSHIYVPARISPEKALEVQKAAERIYRTLGCKGFARVDLFLTPKEELVFNEVNTIPGFTLHSRYPNMLKEAGLSYDEIVEKLIQTEVGE